MIVKHNLSNDMEDETIVQEEAIIPQEELDLDLQLDDTEDVETLKQQLEHEREARRQLTARAKKAEDLVKTYANKPKENQPTQKTSPTDIEETVLLANGMDEELLGQLKKVAQVQGTSLIKAQNDPIFVAVKEKFEKDKKQSEASMPASRGSGQSKPKKDFKTPGLTEAERKAMFEATFNR